MTTTADSDPAPPLSASGDAVIELRGVSHWYGNVVAVNDVSFELRPGITGLLGPNGAGKSTLLHLLAGFLRPSSGDVLAFGEPTWRHPDLYRRVGLVQEHEAVYRSLTGREFVRLNARLFRLPDVEDATRRAIERVDLAWAADRATGTYSKGMRQRIKIAAALVHDPEVLLLDEPFSGADPRQRLQMMEMLRMLAVEGRTILFSSHILAEMERLGERVLVIVAGRLAASGNFRAIRRLMTDRPHAFAIRSSDNRALAQALLGEPAVRGVELDDERLIVRTDDFGSFVVAAPRAARDASVTIRELYPLDESLESVFEYLVAR